MALRWRYENWYIRLWYKGPEHLLATGLTSKQEAKRVERSVKQALKTACFVHLDDLEKELCRQVFLREKLPLPSSLETTIPDPEVASGPGNGLDKDSVTLWDAVNLLLNSPVMKAKPNSERHEEILVHHVIPYFRPERLISGIWIPEIEIFLENMRAKGYAGSTVNKAKAALSIMFKELMKHRLVEANPVPLVGRISEKDGEREIYISYADFTAIVKRTPLWVQPILWFLYMTSGRANEVLCLTPRHVNLGKRIIWLQEHETKNHKKKRLPIHEALKPIIEPLLEGKGLDEPLFMSNKGLPARIDSVRKPWRKAVDEAILELGLNPDLRHVTVKDIRHCTARNLECSGVSEVRREAILGHSLKGKSIEARYIKVTNKDLLEAIDMTTFNHGETEIYITRLALARKKKNPAAPTAGSSV